MKKITLNLFLLFSMFFLLSFNNLLEGREVRGVKGNTVSIGIIMDRTGPASYIGIPYGKSVKNYFRYINDTGGLNGRKIKVIHEDDRYSIPMAIAAFKKLIFGDRVLTILFCGGTGQNTALFKQIKDHKVPVVTGSWSWTMIDPLKRYIFSPGNDNKDEIKIIMNYIAKTLKAKNPRIAIVSPDVEFGKSGVRVAVAKAKELKLRKIHKVILPLGSVDATTQVLNLKKNKITHIILLASVGSTVAVFKCAKMFGYWPSYFGSFHVFGDEVAKIAGPSARNAYGTGAYGSWFDDVEGIHKLKKVTLKYCPNIKPPNRHYVKGWITSIITREGIKRAGKNLTPDTFVDALETIKGLDMKGLTAPISYSPKDHKGNNYARLYKADIKKGYFIPVTMWISSK